MGPVLNGLIKLQSVENQLRAAKAKLARCRRNVIIAENQVRSLQNAYEAKKEEIQLTKVQSDRLELELRTRDEEVAKLRAHLNSAKTNKEYAAVLTQLNTTRADNSKIETQILDLLKDIESDQAESENILNQINQAKGNLEQIRKDSEATSSKYEAEIREIQLQWDKKAQDIPAEPLEVFKRVAETYDGEALAVVDKQQSKTEAYSCGGCFMGITTESVNHLLSKDDLIRCPSCTRILVISDSQE
jgi:predicted  nucleic acid-binding Zn-ribbon protein